ncbi:2Fe-2S iron-sulfur cluster-binding protein [Streptomyces sp. NPDC058442]|uniref:2Fe-2S iron-sulfur cluster-binding protein n=1 Tax=Streptomyces sp. NPDC058442 TaxID=3346503 RepID=UPI00365F8BB2
MTDEQHGEGTSRGGGSRWDPLPQGDYDDGATAFVNLPEGGIEALLDSMESPLAAPGHGYVPPPITVTPAPAGTDPAAPGGWTVPGAPADGAQWNAPYDPQAGPSGQGGPSGGTAGQGGPEERTAQGHSGQDRFTYDPGASGQWAFEEPPAAGNPAPGSDVTGQWSIPVAEGDLPDESGEFTTSALAEQWGATPPVTPPATLPGGAPAPWATQAIGQPWGPGVPGVDPHYPEPGSEPGSGREQDGPEPGRPAEPGRDTPAPGRPAPEPPSPAEPHWRTEPEAYREAAAAPSAPELREHPQPGTEGAVRPAPGPGGPAEAAEGARRPEAPHEAREAPRRPTGDDPSEPAAAPEAAEHPEPSAPPAPDGSPAGPEPLPGAAHDDHPLATYVLSVNGTDRPVTDAWIGESLLYVLRERLGLAGAKDGCSQGECGACNVQVDGRLVASCLVPAVTTAGSEVRTVEGLAQDGQPSDVQRALARCGAVQCGFCVPGMAMTVHDLLEGNPEPSRLETRQALCGNLCRCSGYRGVVEAVQEVVAEREAHAEQAEQAEHTESDPGADPGTVPGEPRIPHQAGPGAGGVNPAAFPPPGPHDRPHGQDGGQA